MTLQKTIYKTFFTLMGLGILSAYGFPIIARGYGSSDLPVKEVLGTSTGPIFSNPLVWQIGLGTVGLGTLGYIIYSFIRRGR